jgi:hypothetical protein
MLRLFSSHSLDHFQHLHRLLFDRGRKLTEANLLLMKASSLYTEFATLVACLSDTEYLQTGPVKGDWSAAQVVEHVVSTERGYRSAVLEALGRPLPAETSAAPGVSVVVRFAPGDEALAVEVARVTLADLSGQLQSVELRPAVGTPLTIEVDGALLPLQGWPMAAKGIVEHIRARSFLRGGASA